MAIIQTKINIDIKRFKWNEFKCFVAFPSHLFCRSILYGVTNPVHILVSSRQRDLFWSPHPGRTLFRSQTFVVAINVVSILYFDCWLMSWRTHHRSWAVDMWVTPLVTPLSSPLLLLLLASASPPVWPSCYDVQLGSVAVLAVAPDNETPGQVTG